MDVNKILSILKGIKLPNMPKDELYLVLKLATIIATAYLANKVEDTMIDSPKEPDNMIDIIE